VRADGAKAEVIVRNDATHGTLAVVTITGAPAATQERLTQRCAELLGGFQTRHIVAFT